MTRVLMILSASDHWTLNDGTQHPTGFWGEEFAVPYNVFTEAGWDVTIATPGGQAPTVDQVSLDDSAGTPQTLAAVKETLDRLKPELAHPASLGEVVAEDYDLVFYPGGHGPMEDLAKDETSGAILTERMHSDAPVALLCHSPAAVVAARTPEGESAVAGRRMTGFSNEEERSAGLADKAPWLLEDKLIELGVDYAKADEPGQPFVVVDGNLYSGQNPASSEELARRIVRDLTR